MDFKHTTYRDSEQRLKEMHAMTTDQGIAVDPTPITLGQDVTVLYTGLLTNHGADQVYLHMGYGTHNTWHDVQTMRMEHTGHGWAKVVKVDDSSRLNLCFKDSANNWDNNNGNNWSFEIHNGERY